MVGIRLALIGSINDEILNKDELALELIRFLQKQYPTVLEDKYQTDASDAVGLLNQIDQTYVYLGKTLTQDGDEYCEFNLLLRPENMTPDLQIKCFAEYDPQFAWGSEEA